MNSTNAWTLTQSYELQNKKDLSTGFLPWILLSIGPLLVGMHIVTSNYDSDGVYRDYLHVATDQIDMLTYARGASCILVEQIDIRGQICQNCTAFICQKLCHSLHSDLYFFASLSCEFQHTGGLYCDGKGEDNFGLLRTSVLLLNHLRHRLSLANTNF